MTARSNATKRPGPAPKRKFPIVPIAIGVAAVALIATVVFTFEGDGVEDAYGTPVITGNALPVYSAGGADPTTGQPAPLVTGADFENNPVAIADDGRAKIVIFLAHWCPFCQAEVPVVQRWLDAGSMPADVDLYAVATSIDRFRPNYPASSWLEREGWTAPIIVDDELNSISRSYGLNAFPFWVFISADGTVFGRTSGELGATALDEIAGALTGG